MGSWLGFLFREIREIAAPISKEGIKADPHCRRDCTRATQFRKKRLPVIYTPSTIIIHGKTLLGGCAKWKLEVPKHVRHRLIDMILKIDTIRTHGVLHSPIKGTSASIWVNDELVDLIYLAQRLPHGTDYGVDSRRPISVFRYIKKRRITQIIKIGVDKDVYWDIDRVTLEPVILRREIGPEAAMIIGAIISALVGALVGAIVSFFI